jgi:citrate lyase subunit beta/citryl-CoA lyase
MNEQSSTGSRKIMEPSSYLFVPANRPERFLKAHESGAHKVIFDLEDAVAPAEKDAARAAIVEWFKNGNEGIIRINGADSYWFAADLRAVATCRNASVMVPKAGPAVVADVSSYLVNRPLIALVETVSGLVQIRETTSVPGVTRLAFGNVDFGSDARLPNRSPALEHARIEIMIASRFAGLPSPIDGVTVEIDDEAILLRDIESARDLGYGAKLCIHPRQISFVNDGFSPTAEEIRWASKILDAVSRAGGNVVQLDGKMIDIPVVERAKYLLGKSL